MAINLIIKGIIIFIRIKTKTKKLYKIKRPISHVGLLFVVVVRADARSTVFSLYHK